MGKGEQDDEPPSPKLPASPTAVLARWNRLEMDSPSASAVAKDVANALSAREAGVHGQRFPSKPETAAERRKYNTSETRTEGTDGEFDVPRSKSHPSQRRRVSHPTLSEEALVEIRGQVTASSELPAAEPLSPCSAPALEEAGPLVDAITDADCRLEDWLAETTSQEVDLQDKDCEDDFENAQAAQSQSDAHLATEECLAVGYTSEAYFASEAYYTSEAPVQAIDSVAERPIADGASSERDTEENRFAS